MFPPAHKCMRAPIWSVHPAAVQDGRYVVFMIKRCRVAGRLYRVGEEMLVPPSRLQVAANLCATGAARPADRRTALDVALMIEMQRVGG